MKMVRGTPPRWIFDYVLKPASFVLVLLGVKVTMTNNVGKVTVYNAEGEKWKWLWKGVTNERTPYSK